DWREAGWSAPAERAEILARYSAATWSETARALLAAPRSWQKWALYDRTPLGHWGTDAVTLLGDAAHPMLPYLAQGAAMAIEDAAVLAQRLAETRDNPAAAMRRYERQRRSRTARAQRAARRNGTIYQLGGPAASLRSLALGAIGGARLIARYDWLYCWTPPCPANSLPACLYSPRPPPEACRTPLGSPSRTDCGRLGASPAPHSKMPSAMRRCSRSSYRRIAASTSSPMASSRASISSTAFSRPSTASISPARSKSGSAPTATRRWYPRSPHPCVSSRGCLRGKHRFPPGTPGPHST